MSDEKHYIEIEGKFESGQITDQIQILSKTFGDFNDQSSKSAKDSANAFAQQIKDSSQLKTIVSERQALIQKEIASNKDLLATVVKNKTASLEASAVIKQSLTSEINQRQDLKKNLSDELTSRQKLKTEIKASSAQELADDKAVIESKSKISKAVLDQSKQVKELTKEKLHQEKVNRALGQSEEYVANTMAKVASGALTLSDAEQKLTKNAQAVAQQILSLNDALKETQDPVKIKQITEEIVKLEKALDTYKEAADSAGDRQLELNQKLQNADDRFSGNAKALGMMTAGLAGLSGTLGNMLGDGGKMLTDFAGSASVAAAGVGSMMDQLKAGKDMGNTFQGMMTQATAYIGLAQVGIQMITQIYQMVDGAIRKGEQEVINKGKEATAMTDMFKSYSLGNKSIQDRIALIDKVAEKDQELASSLRGVAGDATAFNKVLKESTDQLTKVREAGAGKEWEVAFSGGGLLGWLKTTGSQATEWGKNMGQALVAIDEVRMKVTETGQDLSSATSASTDYAKSVKQRIDQMNIQIAQAMGDQKKVQDLTIQGLRDEAEETKKLILEKKELIKQRKTEYETKDKLAIINTRQGAETLLSKGFNPDGKEAGTGVTYSAADVFNAFGFKDKKLSSRLDEFRSAVKKSLDKGLKETDSVIGDVINQWRDRNKMTLEQAYSAIFAGDSDKLKNVGKVDQQTLLSAMVKHFGSDNDITLYIKTLTELTPIEKENEQATKLMTEALVKLDEEYSNVETNLNKLIAKQRELWEAQDKQNKNKKTSGQGLDKIDLTTGVDQDKLLKEVLPGRLKWAKEEHGDSSQTDLIKSMDSVTKNLKFWQDRSTDLNKLISDQKDKLSAILVEYPKLSNEGKKAADVQINAIKTVINELTNQNNATEKAIALKRGSIIALAGEAQKDVQSSTKLSETTSIIEEWQTKLSDILETYPKLEGAAKTSADVEIQAIKSVIDIGTQREKQLQSEIDLIIKGSKVELQSRQDQKLVLQEELDFIRLNGREKTELERQEEEINKKYKDRIQSLKDIGASQEDINKLQGVKAGEINTLRENVSLQKQIDAEKQKILLTNQLIKESEDKIKQAIEDEKNLQKQFNQEVETWSKTRAKSDYLNQFKPKTESIDEFFKTIEDRFNKIKNNNPLKKISDDLTKSLDDLNYKQKEQEYDLDQWYNEQITKYKGNEERQAKIKEEYEQRKTSIVKQAESDRLNIQKKNIESIVSLWESELGKLESMQTALNNRLEAREKTVKDSRSKMTEEVTRLKLKEGEKQAYNLADQLAKEYEAYRKAGLDETELQEWLGLKKTELTKGLTKEEISLFEKFYNDKKKLADAAANADKQAWDDETQRQKNAITDQKKLVDELRQSAIDAKQILLDLLGIKVPTPATSSGMKTIAPDDVPKPTVDPPPGTEWEWQVIGGIGRWVAVPVKTIVEDITPQPKDGKTTPPKSDVPIETSAEIQARIDGYKALQEIANKTEENIRTWAKTTIDDVKTYHSTKWQEIIKIWEVNSPRSTEGWGKKLYDLWHQFGSRLATALVAPIIEQIDPAHAILGSIGHDAFDWGSNIVEQFGNGMYAKKAYLTEQIRRLIDEAIAPLLKKGSPPKEGPLSQIKVWGANIVEQLAYGMSEATPVLIGTIGTITKDFAVGLSQFTNTISSQVSKGVRSGFQGEMSSGQWKQFSAEHGITDLEGAKELKNYLLTGQGVSDFYKQRTSFNKEKVQDFEAYTKLIDIESRSSEINRLYKDFGVSGLKTSSDEKVMTWFMTNWDKGIITPDLGEISLGDVKKTIQDHPEWKTYYPLQKQLQDQYPEIYKLAVEQGVLIPVDPKKKMRGSKVVEWSQTGDLNQKVGMDMVAEYFGDNVDTFSEFLQKDFLKERSDKGGSPGLNDWFTARTDYLNDYNPERIRDLVSRYVDYVKGTGAVLDSVSELEKSLSENYTGTDISKSLMSGTSGIDTLINSKWTDLTGERALSKMRDRTVVSGGGFFDDKGNEVIDEDLWKQIKGGDIGGEAMSKLMMDRLKGTQIPEKIKQFRNGITQRLGGHTWGWGWFYRGEGGTPVSLPFTVMENSEALKLKQSGYDIAAMSYEEMVKRYGEDAVKKMIEQGLWGYILLSADRAGGNQIGNFSDIDKEVSDFMSKFTTERESLMKSIKTGGTPKEGDSLSGLTYKNKYKTVSGNKGYGLDVMKQMFGDMTDSQRSSIMEGLSGQIDKTFSDKAYQYVPFEGQVQGDSVENKMTIHEDWGVVRNRQKAILAGLLGYTPEYSIARGWMMPGDKDNYDLSKLSYEELQKNIQTLDGFINTNETQNKLAKTAMQREEVGQVAELIDYYIDNGLLDEFSIKGIQEGIKLAVVNGNMTEDEAIGLIQKMVPEKIKIPSELWGLPGYDPKQGLLSSVWGINSPSKAILGNTRNLIPQEWLTSGNRSWLPGQGDISSDYPVNPFDYYWSRSTSMGLPPEWTGQPDWTRMTPERMMPFGYGQEMSGSTVQINSGAGQTENNFYFTWNNNTFNGVDSVEESIVDIMAKMGFRKTE